MRRLLPLVVAIAVTTGCTFAATSTGTGQPPAAATQAPAPAPVPTPTPQPWDQLGLTWLFHPSGNLPADPSHVRTLIATGDFIPAREVNAQAVRRNDFLWTVRPTADYVKNADITYVNLETPLFSGCKVDENGFQFCGDARHVDALKAVGAKVVNLANNHLGNYGPTGVQNTVDLLGRNGIATSGLGPP